MVIKVPVYLAFEEKLHPDEVSEVTEEVRISLTKAIKDRWPNLKIDYLGREIDLTIISSAEVKALMTGTPLGSLRKLTAAKKRAQQRH